MGLQACTGAVLTCTFGLAPTALNVLPTSQVMVSNLPAATMMDNAPMVNVPTFGMCNSLANPTVAAATTAALGVLTPMPCIPVLPAPWMPGVPTVLIGNKPALDDTCKLMCAYGGMISMSFAGQVQMSE